MQQTISKSPLFTLNNIHYLCTDDIQCEDFKDYQFEKSTPDSILDNLPTEIQNQIRELGDSYFTIAIIPHKKVSDFATKLKNSLKQKLENIIKDQSISYEDLYDNLPDMIQNLAALQDIDNSIELNNILSLIEEIDKFSKESLSSMILF